MLLSTPLIRVSGILDNKESDIRQPCGLLTTNFYDEGIMANRPNWIEVAPQNDITWTMIPVEGIMVPYWIAE
jgi:hypothetical protein